MPKGIYDHYKIRNRPSPLKGKKINGIIWNKGKKLHYKTWNTGKGGYRNVLWIKKYCRVCKNEFEVLPSRNAKIFCSRKCSFIGRRKSEYNRNGVNNPNWRGGITKLRYKIWKSENYQKWRFNIFRKDNYICQMCEKRGGNLEADHYPKMFVDFLKEYKIDSLKKAIQCKALWKANGRTLCRKCHEKTFTFKGNQYAIV